MDRLPPSALPAWQAYNAMVSTKQRHFDYMSLLEERYQKYGEPTTEESELLARLLAEHDEQVKIFLTAMNALRDDDPPAHQELVAYLTRLNEMAGSKEPGESPPRH